MWPPFCLTTSCKLTLTFVTTFRHKSSESARHIFTMWALSCATFQGPHSEVVSRAFWRLVSKSCDECKGSFARGCEAKRWSHWPCSSLGTIFQPMRINSVPDVKCFCNNKNVLREQSMVWHFVRHPVLSVREEKKEPTDDTSKDVYSLLAQHVSGIIMPIVRRQTE